MRQVATSGRLACYFSILAGAICVHRNMEVKFVSFLEKNLVCLLTFLFEMFVFCHVIESYCIYDPSALGKTHTGRVQKF